MKERAYPFSKDVATHLEQISTINSDGVRRLPLSSSSEIFDNSINAWFKDMTNYDLSLMHFALSAAGELADELKLTEEAKHRKSIEAQLPDFNLDKNGALTFAKGFPYNQSHRHFSHAISIHSLGLIDWSQGQKSQKITKATLKKLQNIGPDYWCSYSYNWFGNMKARTFDREGAAETLRTFAE